MKAKANSLINVLFPTPKGTLLFGPDPLACMETTLLPNSNLPQRNIKYCPVSFNNFEIITFIISSTFPLMTAHSHSMKGYTDNSRHFNQQGFMYKTTNLLQHKSQVHKGLHPFLTGVYHRITLTTIKKCESNVQLAKINWFY